MFTVLFEGIPHFAQILGRQYNIVEPAIMGLAQKHGNIWKLITKT